MGLTRGQRFDVTDPLQASVLSDGAGDENRTRMTSLEGICAPTRGDSYAPAGLTSLHREAPSLAMAQGPRRARRTTAVRFAVFLLWSPEARAATRTATAIDPASLTVTGTRLLGPAGLALVMN